MAKKQQAETPKEAAPEQPAEQVETPKAVYPDGFRTFLYHADAPEGRLFVGSDANQALANGWVDHPGKVNGNGKK